MATGFKDLDYQTSGFQPSDLILIAARPSMGKTAFVLNIAQYMAFRHDVTVAIFSLEMSKEQLVNRLLSMESGVDDIGRHKIRVQNIAHELHAADLFRNLLKKVFDLVQRRNAGEFVPIKQVVLNAIQKIETASRTKGNVTGVATGFKDLLW